MKCTNDANKLCSERNERPNTPLPSETNTRTVTLSHNTHTGTQALSCSNGASKETAILPPPLAGTLSRLRKARARVFPVPTGGGRECAQLKHNNHSSYVYMKINCINNVHKKMHLN